MKSPSFVIPSLIVILALGFVSTFFMVPPSEVGDPDYTFFYSQVEPIIWPLRIVFLFTGAVCAYYLLKEETAMKLITA